MLKRYILELTVLYSVALYVASVLSLQNTGIPLKAGSDKVLHFSAHFFYVILWFFVFTIRWNTKKNEALLKSFVISVCFGIFIEVSQEVFTITREADSKDVLANVMGAVLGGVIAHLISKSKIKI